MPYLGDAPSNPITLTPVADVATGEISGVGDHDRPICWFSLPAQTPGSAIRLSSKVGGVFEQDRYEICMVWDGGNAAHLVNSTGVSRQASSIRMLPDSTAVLIAVFPRAVAWGHPFIGPVVSLTGQNLPAASPKTVAEWATYFDTYVVTPTRRLLAGGELVVEVLPDYETSLETLDFSSSGEVQTLDFTTWDRPTRPVNLIVPAQYDGVLVEDLSGVGAFQITPEVGDFIPVDHVKVVYLTQPPSEGGSVLGLDQYSLMPSGIVAVRPVVVANVSGSATDTDGSSPEPVNVLLFRTQDALAAVEAPSGTYTLPNVVEGDYILVAFSRADGRDVRATNVLVPPGTRAAGGGYDFGP